MLDSENKALLVGIVSILKMVGGSIEVPNNVVAAVDLHKDVIEVSENFERNTHTISLRK